MKELDHLAVELSGITLIEASAGTGKTYAITCLYLRLLIESGLMPEQILVVTYTEAATAELKGRIRTRLREALDVLNGAETDDGFLKSLCDTCNVREGGQEAARNVLQRALESFDLAAICTIHGFCLRALQDNAFESGSLYDTELVTDQDGMLREVVDDFWRMTFFADPAPLLDYALRTGLTPRHLSGFLKKVLGNPMAKIIPEFDPGRVSALEQECRELFAATRQSWLAGRDEVRDIIENDAGLSRSGKYYRTDQLPPLIAAMDVYAAGDNPFAIFDEFDKVTASGIRAGKKPKGAPLAHPFFDLCEELADAVRSRFLALRAELRTFAVERLAVRRRELNIRFFDDLIADLYTALNGPCGSDLAARLRGTYRAALVDEFQDTDPVQYDIFRKIFDEPDCPMFLIGDPKQAIYSFRGADIFAYLEAASGIAPERRYTLTGNWRSTPRLLAAFNAMFGSTASPFVYNEIAYHPVTPGTREDRVLLECDGAEDAPLQLWLLPPGQDGAPSSVGAANRAVPAAVAAEIARLVAVGREGRACIGGKPVLPEDIAVIVRSHRQARFIQDSLRRCGIPSVMRSDMSVFASGEARELLLLLQAIAEPGNEPFVRSALVTGIIGLNGNDIAALLENESAWEGWLEKFRDYHQLWLVRGFMAMAQALLSREGVRGRLLARPDGERRLTDLLHCVEIVHGAEHEQRLGVAGLVSWFGERFGDEDAAEEHQIRLETDEKAVKIVTVHVSKGLEYPVVFCPFLWGGIRSDDEVVSFHDGFRMVKDFGSPDRHRHIPMARKEALSENLRLLYVALTRAKARCYLVGGKIVDRTGRNRPETSPLAYLFHASGETRQSENLVDMLAEEVKKLTAEDMEEQLAVLAARAEGAISVVPMPGGHGTVPPLPACDDTFIPVCREFAGTIDASWRVWSFTSISSHGPKPTELPDRDETGDGGTFPIAAPDVPADRGKSMFSFPRGAGAGIVLHEIFEAFDFAGGMTDQARSGMAECLRKHTFNGEWLPYICDMVEKVITADLADDGTSFTLSHLKRGKWLPELEFYLPLRFVTSDILRSCLRRWDDACATVNLTDIGRFLTFTPARGMLRGFMDLVFEHEGRYYLVDWKSNHLGNSVEAYGQEALRRSMTDNLYPLQYLLYTVALNRYLGLRIPGYDYATHFGGVRYLFLRGVDPSRGPEYGIFRDFPPCGLIRDLTECLIEVEQ